MLLLRKYGPRYLEKAAYLVNEAASSLFLGDVGL